MKTHNKTAIIITQNELNNRWLEDIVSVIGNESCFFIVDELDKFNWLDKIFLKLNFKIFGSQKGGLSQNLNIIQNENFDVILQDYHTILNFTKLELFSKADDKNYIQFLISDLPYGLYSVVNHTLKSYKKVKLTIKSNNNILRVSTIRLNPFSISKNIELILSSFLVLLNSNIKNADVSELPLERIETFHIISIKDYFQYALRCILKLKYYVFYNEQWIIGYSFNTETIGIDLDNDIKIIPPKDRFWADPVVVQERGRFYVFIEELIYKNKIAHLSVFELRKDGSVTAPKIILKKPYHLSYPNVFKYMDKYYMIPETANNNDIQLYEAVSFPFSWKLKQTLIKGIKASDTTLLYKDGKWWLFTSIKRFDKATYDNDLSVFYSNNLFSEDWTSHLRKPIKQDICNARQAGPFFNSGDNYYRISQNCASNYGYGFNINKLESITETDFNEKIEYSFIPDNIQDIMGSHTYNHIEGKLRLYDLLIRTFKY